MRKAWEANGVAGSRERRRRVAWHEAGHALVGYLVGVELVSVDLERAEAVIRRGALADPVSLVTAFMAGLEADWLAGGESADRALDGAMHDRENAAQAAARLEPRNPDGLIVRAQAIARGLLDRHWLALERLTAALIVSGRMDGALLEAEVEAALDGVGLVDWIVARRAAADAAGTDPAARGAAWTVAGRRWHGAAQAETREVYATTWRVGQARAFEDMLRRRAAIEAAAAAELAGEPIYQ